LKLKEITYLHAEAYPAGELKHGTISLIEPGVPVVAVLTQGAVATKTLSGADEVRARGARVLVLASEGISLPPEWDACVRLPVPSSETAPLVATFAMQLLAFQVCSELGIDPDQPRNLAKSVTVE
jgi:glucosamine--fructose-6-phosphate aminotransferase (isomerizing)